MNNKRKGLIIILFCSLMWAFNGNIGAWLFKEKSFTPDILVSIRLLGAGLSIMVLNFIRNGPTGFYILQVKSNYIKLAFYALGGILLMQYSYFSSILYSNAPTSTLLQYLGIFLIILAMSIKTHSFPERKIFVALFFCILGVVFLVTHGDWSLLSINQKALFWGLLSSIGFANFNLAPLSLQARYKSLDIVGPSMLLAGLTLFLLVRPDLTQPNWDILSLLGLIYCIFGGTFFPFVLFMEGQRLAGPSLSSIFALAEPVFSTLIAIFLYNTIFLTIDFIGMFLIFTSILLLTLEDSKKKE